MGYTPQFSARVECQDITTGAFGPGWVKLTADPVSDPGFRSGSLSSLRLSDPVSELPSIPLGAQAYLEILAFEPVTKRMATASIPLGP